MGCSEFGSLPASATGAAGGQSAELAKWAQQAYGGGEDKGPGVLPKLDPRASWVFSLLATTVAMGTIAAKLLSRQYANYRRRVRAQGKCRLCGRGRRRTSKVDPVLMEHTGVYGTLGTQ
jgi:hypothetical protein